MTWDLIALIREGLSDRQIETRTGVSRRKVARIRKDEGLPLWSAPEPEHGTTARYRRGCRCSPCREARAAYASAEYARSGRTQPPSVFPAKKSAALAAMHRADQARLHDRATASRQRWTEDDLAVAGDYSLSAVQVAEKLGRSLGSVRHQRRKRRMSPAPGAVLPRGRRATRDK